MKNQKNIKARRIMFLRHLKKEDVNLETLKALNEELKDKAKRVVMQIERGKQGVNHIQGFAQFRESQRISRLNKLAKDLGFKYEIRQGGEKELEDCKFYCLKRGENGRVNDDLFINWSDKLGYLQDIEDRDIPLLSLKERESIQKKERLIKRGKVNTIYNLTRKLSNERRIFFLYDERGGSGKSSFARYMEEKEGAIVIDVQYGMDNHQLIQAVASFCLKKKYINNKLDVFLNCPRDLDASTFMMLMSVAESIKGRNVVDFRHSAKKPWLPYDTNVYILTNNVYFRVSNEGTAKKKMVQLSNVDSMRIEDRNWFFINNCALSKDRVVFFDLDNNLTSFLDSEVEEKEVRGDIIEIFHTENINADIYDLRDTFFLKDQQEADLACETPLGVEHAQGLA